MVRITEFIRVKHLTQVQAAELFGVTQPLVSDLVRGKIDLFSIDMLVNMAGKVGMKVNLAVEVEVEVE